MDAASLLELQKQFFATGQTRDLDFRLACLRRLGAVIEKKEAAILQALSADLGKPALEAYLAEIFFLKQELRLVVKNLRRWARPAKAGAPFYFFPIRNEIRREPFGCSLLLSTWNYPIQISLAPLISSIAAGNCVTLKPSELAPRSAGLLAEIVTACFGREHAAVVEGDAAVAESLLAQPYQVFFFTGSTGIGRKVALAAARHLAPAILELGGKCPVVLGPEVDGEEAANRIAAAKFLNAGQVCIAPDFVLVHESRRESFAATLHRQIRVLYEENTGDNLARIINRRHYDRLLALVAGETCLQAGRDDPENLRLAPRLVPLASPGSALMEEEIFGPILPLLPYRDEAGILEILKRHPNPLGLYIFSHDREFAERIIAAHPSGSVCVNDLMKQAVNLSLPFGGVGQSGMGRYRGRFGFEAFTWQRPVSRRSLGRDWFKIQPPYAGKWERFRRFLR